MNIINVLAFILKVLLEEFSKTRKVIKKAMADVQAQLDDIEKKLDEASMEILAEIAKLKGENLTPAGQETLNRITAKAQGLADIVPGPEAPPTP